MPTKIRLSRHGKKGKAFFHIVVADSRAPRDGKFIEKIGTYNPNSNPATIVLDTEKAFQWMTKGARLTDTSRAIMSYKGVLHRMHLAEGVRKGALTQEKADQIHAEWLASKENKIDSKKSGVLNSKTQAEQARLAAESKLRETREKAIAAKNAAALEVVAENTADEATEENAPEENAPETSQEEGTPSASDTTEAAQE